MTSRFDISATPLTGVLVVARQVRSDERGWFERMYCSDDLAALLEDRNVVEVNRTMTRRRGAVRGMHYQIPPSAEAKLITCLRGAIFDVALDLRRTSPTFLRWHAERLAADSPRSLFVPEGVAHGFQTLTDDCELLYLHTAHYDPSAERAINPLDPAVAIAWPFPVAQLSERDAAHPFIGSDFQGATP